MCKTIGPRSASARGRRMTSAGLAAVLALLILGGPVAVADEPVYKSWFGTAIRGYDPVAYFTAGRPVKGDSDFEYQWRGATWKLSSAENLALFREDPEKYVPAYGGYCAWAVAKGDLVKSDPEVWKIVDHRLYLNYSRKVQEDWEKDIPGFIAKAEANWPRLAAKN